jgi:hypothetical protein
MPTALRPTSCRIFHRRWYAVNLKSVFLMCKAITSYFIEKRA